VLEKATELGVAQIRPVITRRCVADKLNAERAKRSSPRPPNNARARPCPRCPSR
jgi:hypothetical protein